jgi:hypothetical protein
MGKHNVFAHCFCVEYGRVRVIEPKSAKIYLREENGRGEPRISDSVFRHAYEATKAFMEDIDTLGYKSAVGQERATPTSPEKDSR